jgi:hypothetical protein
MRPDNSIEDFVLPDIAEAQDTDNNSRCYSALAGIAGVEDDGLTGAGEDVGKGEPLCRQWESSSSNAAGSDAYSRIACGSIASYSKPP